MGRDANHAPPSNRPVHLVFACWGNICRSPTAEGIMRHQVTKAGLDAQVTVDSVGSSGEHDGQAPHRRTVTEAAARGIDLRDLRARRIQRADWHDAAMILVADDMVDRSLRQQAPGPDVLAKLHRMTAFGPDADHVPEVPDPYYGDHDGFGEVYDLLERSCTGLLDHIRAGYNLG